MLCELSDQNNILIKTTMTKHRAAANLELLKILKKFHNSRLNSRQKNSDIFVQLYYFLNVLIVDGLRCQFRVLKN